MRKACVLFKVTGWGQVFLTMWLRRWLGRLHPTTECLGLTPDSSGFSLLLMQLAEGSGDGSGLWPLTWETWTVILALGFISGLASAAVHIWGADGSSLAHSFALSNKFFKKLQVLAGAAAH